MDWVFDGFDSIVLWRSLWKFVNKIAWIWGESALHCDTQSAVESDTQSDTQSDNQCDTQSAESDT